LVLGFADHLSWFFLDSDDYWFRVFITYLQFVGYLLLCFKSENFRSELKQRPSFWVLFDSDEGHVAVDDNSVKVVYGFGPKGWPNHP
jgi:hypothetical protein